MRTIVTVDVTLLAEATRLTGIANRTALVEAALRALIARECALRLAALGGTEPQLRPIRRRRLPGNRPIPP